MKLGIAQRFERLDAMGFDDAVVVVDRAPSETLERVHALRAH